LLRKTEKKEKERNTVLRQSHKGREIKRKRELAK
jgi:hypothetical protein